MIQAAQSRRSGRGVCPRLVWAASPELAYVVYADELELLAVPIEAGLGRVQVEAVAVVYGDARARDQAACPLGPVDLRELAPLPALGEDVYAARGEFVLVQQAPERLADLVARHLLRSLNHGRGLVVILGLDGGQEVAQELDSRFLGRPGCCSAGRLVTCFLTTREGDEEGGGEDETTKLSHGMSPRRGMSKSYGPRTI